MQEGRFSTQTWPEKFEIILKQQLDDLCKSETTTTTPRSKLIEKLYQRDFGSIKGNDLSLQVPTMPNNFTLEELYGTLYRLKVNTTETVQSALLLSGREIIKKDNQTLIMASTRSYEKHFDVCEKFKDNGLLYLLYQSLHDEGELCNRIWLTTATVLQDEWLRFYSRDENNQGEIAPVTLAELNQFCQMKKEGNALLKMPKAPHEDYFRPVVGVKEGICCYDSEKNKYEVVFSSDALCEMSDRCTNQVFQEYQTKKDSVNYFLNHTAVLTYEADNVEFSVTEISDFKTKLQHFLKQYELDLECVVITSPATVTLYCNQQPTWRFSKHVCHHRTKQRSPSITTFCLRKAVYGSPYCLEHKSSHHHRGEGKEELREMLSYYDRPKPVLKPILEFNNGGGSKSVTLKLKSISYVPKQAQKNHLLEFEKMNERVRYIVAPPSNF